MSIASKEDIKLLKENFKKNEIVSLEPNTRYPDGYHCKVLKVSNNGKIELQLIEIYPCM